MNIKPPPIHFGLRPGDPALTPDSALWSAPLPSSRHAFGRSRKDSAVDEAMSYGDYFSAVRDFLMKDNLTMLGDAVCRMAGESTASSELAHIAVYLVKHGAFYHPAYVEVEAWDRRWAFVLNVAVSRQGRRLLVQEHQVLSQLNKELPANFWPQVYGVGHGKDLDGHRVPMFLGQWLEGFYEFHLSGDKAQRGFVEVWDTGRGRRSLRHDQAAECLGQAARILAYAYNPLTFEAIRHWHHAAGDFVIALDGDEIALRLITARQYSPLIDNPEPDVAVILEALLVYLIEVSLKLRIDRLDGIGPMACYGEEAVPTICRGFFQGLKRAASHRGLPSDFEATAKAYAALHGFDQLKETASAVLEKADFDPEERDLLQSKLDGHVQALVGAVSG